MSQQNQGSSPFYIGWQTKAPEVYSAKVRGFIRLLLLIVPLVAALLVLTQRGFEASVFEFGKLTTVEGILLRDPVPMLKVPLGKDAFQKDRYSSILLVGFGKKGADQDLAAIEQHLGKPLSNKAVQLRGTLIYHDGKTALELTEGDAAFAGWGDANANFNFSKQDLGRVKLRGEIYDPKCALGVMKPGYGKPHRSCAVRCISGGIPPVLRVANAAGRANYFLLLDEAGKPIHKKVLNYVADQVQVCGRLEQQDDWMVLYLDPVRDIFRLQPHFMEGKAILCKDPN